MGLRTGMGLGIRSELTGGWDRIVVSKRVDERRGGFGGFLIISRDSMRCDATSRRESMYCPTTDIRRECLTHTSALLI